MMQNILPPPALQGDERAQLTQVYRYLFRLSEQLNVGLSALEQRTAAVARPSGGALSPEGTDGEQFWTEADAQYSSLKSLIIKTANLVRAEMDQIVANLGSEYVAVSEWGTYKEEVSREIVDTAKYTMENFEYNEEILNIPEMAAIFDSYRIETTGYIKRGIIGFDDENYPIFGIAIGQELKHKEVTVGGEVYEVFDERQNMATYAADKLSFWVNGVEVAYLSNSELVVTRIIVSDSIQLGNWDIAVNAADGMTVQKRIGSELDLSENNTFTITADKINAVADQIDLSGNTSIVLTAEQVNAVADQINLSGNATIEMIVGRVEQNAEDIASLDIHTGDNPPAAPLVAGKLWIDTGVTPTVIRRWRGLDVSTDREYSIAGSAFSLSAIDAYFAISNGSGTSGWTLASNSSAGVNLAPGNFGVNSSTAAITLKAVRDLSSVTITGAYYTETNFDKLTLTVAGTAVLNAVSGTSARAQRFSGSLAEGAEIVLKYVKDVSTSATNEANTLFTITSSDTVPAGYTASGWDTISDTQEIEKILSQVEQTAESAQDAASSAQDAAESAKSTADNALPRVEFQRVVRIDDEGLHVGDNQSNGEVLVDSSSVNVVFNGQKYSKFSGNYVQFGNYQLRRTSDGGLVFKLA